MKPERWKQIEQLYYAARKLDSDQCVTFLDQSCAGDESLRLEVMSLLASNEQAGGFLATPALKIATEEIAEEQTRSLAGRQLGHYRLLSQLGAGGMGEVYLAARADDQYRKQVAIKLLKRGMDTDNILSRFRHERQILAALNHHNITRLLDCGVSEDGLPYFVMEYIAGAPITEYCDRHQLSTEARINLFLQVAPQSITRIRTWSSIAISSRATFWSRPMALCAGPIHASRAFQVWMNLAFTYVSKFSQK
jgi:eukaryotic-like serine/threonine-protein kinase